ncbi:HEAT repeat domain-containing protein [Acidobacteriota bacterium]
MKKQRLKQKLFVLWILFLMSWAARPVQSFERSHSFPTKEAVKTLILTGQNSHDWRTSSPILKQILDDTDLFDVQITLSPEKGGSMKNFSPEFSEYHLVVLDYNGDLWPKRTQQDFVSFVESGGGVVVYHNSSNAFSDWIEYSEIIGLGGGQRDETAGPYVFWKNGLIVQDESAGIGGYHGALFEFPVFNRDSVHPITSGLPLKWMHAKDELYSLMRGSAKNLHILATAYSDMQKKGTGRHEPVLFTNRYGEGRIFHTTLGHVSGESPFPAVECAGFIVTFQRGAEWAATGKVTQVIPGDFPGLEREVPTPSDVRRWPGSRSPSLKSILDELKVYEYGQEEGILSRMREYILTHNKNPLSKEQCENQLIKFLESNATLAGKMAVCRQLRQIGSANSVVVLEKMLFQNETSDMARYALEKIPGAESEKALLRSLENNTKKNIVGIVSSLGQREARSAVPGLSRLLSDDDVSVAGAAAKALGWIGGREAVDVLSSALKDGNEALRFQAAFSLLKCAEKYQVLNQSQEAIDLYKKLMETHFPSPVIQAALKGLLTSDKNGAKFLLLDILKGENIDLQITAIGQIRTIFKDSEIQEVLALIPNLPVRSQIALFPVVSRFPPEQVLPVVLDAAGDESADVRIAALEALKIIGDASVVPLLVDQATQSKGREKQAAQISLWNLNGPDVNQAVILELIKVSVPSRQRELIRCVGERRIEEGKHLLFDFVSVSDPLTRQYAISNLGRIVDASDLPGLLDLFSRLDQDSDKAGLREVVSISASFITNRNRRSSAVLEKLKTIEDEQGQSDLLRVLGVLGDNRTLPLLRQALKNPNSLKYDSAVRALIEWPDSTPRDDLLGIAQTADILSLRVLSLRSYIQMAGSERYRSPDGVIRSLQKGLDLTERPEEKIQILALLPRFPCARAVKMAQALLLDESVQAEASLALKIMLHNYIKISVPFRGIF